MKKRYYLLLVLILLNVLYWFGPKPTPPTYSTTWPEINLPVDEFVATHENRPDIKAENEAKISWFNDSNHNKTEFVLLYLHGYSASKVEGNPVYTDFAKRYGCNVFAARLHSQGIDTAEPLLNYNAEKLWRSAVLALAVAEKLGQKIIIMSTSTGGTLALKLAAEFPDKVHALINLSPNIRPRPWNAALLNNPWGLQVGKFVLGGDYRILEEKDENYGKYWNSKYRVESLVELQNLVETSMTKETFKKVHCPVLNVFYYKDEEHQDPVVSVKKIKWMHKELGTKVDQKELVAVENAGTHTIGCGLYCQDIVEVEHIIYSFSERVLKLEPATLAH